jgi:hypothetical protein
VQVVDEVPEQPRPGAPELVPVGGRKTQQQDLQPVEADRHRERGHRASGHPPEPQKLVQHEAGEQDHPDAPDRGRQEEEQADRQPGRERRPGLAFPAEGRPAYEDQTRPDEEGERDLGEDRVLELPEERVQADAGRGGEGPREGQLSGQVDEHGAERRPEKEDDQHLHGPEGGPEGAMDGGQDGREAGGVALGAQPRIVRVVDVARVRVRAALGQVPRVEDVLGEVVVPALPAADRGQVEGGHDGQKEGGRPHPPRA